MTWGTEPTDPTSSIAPPPPPPPPPRPPAPGGWVPPAAPPRPGGEVRPARGLATATVVLLAMSGATAIGALLTQLSLRAKTTAVIDTGTSGSGLVGNLRDLRDAENMANAWARLSLVAVVVTGIVFVIWFYRVVTNLVAAQRWRGGAPGMAAGGWFIPVANFVIPVRYANAAWTSTDHDADHRGKGVIVVWWTLWVVQAVVRLVAGAIDPNANDVTLTNFFAKLDDYKAARAVYMVAFALLALAAVAAIRFVQALTKRADAVTGG